MASLMIPPQQFLQDFTICVTDIQAKDKLPKFQLTMTLKSKDWTLSKTLPQFNQLFKTLELKTYDIGLIEQRVHFKQVPLEEIRKQINIQIQRLAGRKDVVQTKEWAQFLHINNFAVIQVPEVVEMGKIETKTGLMIKDFQYSIETDALFCLEVQGRFTQKNQCTNLSGIDVLEERTAMENLTTFQGKYRFTQCTCFHWNEKSTMLIVATIRSLQVYRISVQRQYQYEPFSVIDMTGKPEIISMTMSAYNGHIYALTAKSLAIININTSKIVMEMPSNHENTAMLLNEQTQILYLAKNPSSIFIFKIQDDNAVPTLLAHFKSETPSKILSLQLSSDKCYLLGLTDLGSVMIFDIPRGKQKLSQHISSITVSKQSESMSFCQKLKLLFVNYKNSVVVINSMNVQQYVIEFKERIVKVKYYFPEGVLVIGDEMGGVRFVKYLPEKEEEPDLPIRKKLEKWEEKDSDDEIDGWANQMMM